MTIAKALRQRVVMEDATFDAVFPARQRFRSWLHWTPVDVAMRAVDLLAPTRRCKVLDVGSGVGKLCLIGAAVTRSMWFGIERDLEMVRAANTAAMRMRVEGRIRFLHGDIASLDWSIFDAFYLFNPFGEILLFDSDDALSRRERYAASIAYVQRQLSRARAGTRVVTYHGFGGEMPSGFTVVHREPAHEDELVLWVRQPAL